VTCRDDTLRDVSVTRRHVAGRVRDTPGTLRDVSVTCPGVPGVDPETVGDEHEDQAVECPGSSGTRTGTSGRGPSHQGSSPRCRAGRRQRPEVKTTRGSSTSESSRSGSRPPKVETSGASSGRDRAPRIEPAGVEHEPPGGRAARIEHEHPGVELLGVEQRESSRGSVTPRSSTSESSDGGRGSGRRAGRGRARAPGSRAARVELLGVELVGDNGPRVEHPVVEWHGATRGLVHVQYPGDTRATGVERHEDQAVERPEVSSWRGSSRGGRAGRARVRGVELAGVEPAGVERREVPGVLSASRGRLVG